MVPTKVNNKASLVPTNPTCKQSVESKPEPIAATVIWVLKFAMRFCLFFLEEGEGSKVQCLIARITIISCSLSVLLKGIVTLNVSVMYKNAFEALV